MFCFYLFEGRDQKLTPLHRKLVAMLKRAESIHMPTYPFPRQPRVVKRDELVLQGNVDIYICAFSSLHPVHMRRFLRQFHFSFCTESSI